MAGCSVGEEIRRRLRLSFGAATSGQVDAKTRELLDVIGEMAVEVEQILPPWHADAGSYRTFTAALTQWVQQYKPEGAAVLKPKPTAERLFGRRPLTIDNVAMLLLHAAHSYVAGPPEHEEKEDH